MSGYQNFVWEEELCMISKTFAIAVLEDHMRETHRIYKCSVCVFTSSSDKDLKVHTTESHTKYDYKCKIGEYSTYDIKKHKEIEHQLPSSISSIIFVTIVTIIQRNERSSRSI